MDFKKAYAIAIKDLTEVFSSPSIYGPMLGIPIFMAILLPLLTFYVTTTSATSIISSILGTSTTFITSGPIGGVAFMNFFSTNILGPIFLTMPILTATVIAADSFAGEKERKTSEALLATPLEVDELLVGKITSSFIPAVLLTIGIFGIYGYITNWLSFSNFHTYLLPTTAWLLMLLTAPFLAIAAIGVIVLVSSHVKGIKEAQQISTLLILPILVMPFASILGIATLTVSFFAWLILALFIIDVLILYIGIKSFNKEKIL